MVSHAKLDRREFLAISALTSVATLLPESVYGYSIIRNRSGLS